MTFNAFKRLTLSCVATSLLCSSFVGNTEESTLNLSLTDTITVSGVSSGGYMANQFHIAHSYIVSGAGIVAAGPYLCSAGDLMTAMKQCLADGSALAEKDLLTPIQQLAEQASIAATKNLKGDRVWLLHGTLDKRVGEDVSEALHIQYKSLVDSKHLQSITDKPFNHGLPTKDFGVDCSTTATPFINNCNYDAAQTMLDWLYPDAEPQESNSKGNLYTIQQPQNASGKANGLADTAWLYVPQQCSRGETCELHISFHGCQQNQASIDKSYIEHGGFNAQADKHDLVILYPQVASNNPVNPLACWDWWGYTGSDFAQRTGPQIQTVFKLVQGLQQNQIPLTRDTSGETK